MPVESWFPSVIFFEDLELDPRVETSVLETVHERADVLLATTEPGGVTADNAANDLHLDPRMAPLLALFGPPLKRFLFDDLLIDPSRVQFHIGRCWPVVEGAGTTGGALHQHRGAMFSGVFYLQAPEGSGALQFLKPYRTSFDSLARTDWNPLTYERAEYPAIAHRLIVFSSDLDHRRLPSAEAVRGQRVAIAFDLYSMVDLDVKGGGIPHYDMLRRIV